MPMTPQPDWKRLTVDELVTELDKFDEQNMPIEHDNVVLVLIHLIKTGRAKAFLRPDGEIMYQFAEKDPVEEETP